MTNPAGDKTEKIFAWTQLILLIISSPLFLFPREEWAWSLLLVFGLWAAAAVFFRQRFRRTRLDLPVAVLLVLLFFGVIFTGNYRHAFPKVAGFLFALALYYATVALLRTEKSLKTAILLFLTGGFGFSLLGLLGMYTFKVKHLDFLMKIKEKIPQVDFNLAGAESGFAPNPVGGVLLLFLPLAAVLLYVHSPLRRLTRSMDGTTLGKPLYMFFFSLGAFLMFLLTLMLTQSRGAWLALLITGAALVLIRLYRWKKYAPWIVLTAFLAVIPFFPKLTAIDTVALTSRQAQGTMAFRLQMWDQALPRIAQQPLLGIGLNEFRYLPEIKYEESHAHNKILHLAVEMGVLAAAAYVALLILTGYMIVAGFKSAKTGWLKMAFLGLGAGQLAHALFEITDVIPFGSKVGVIPWLSLALLSAMYNYTFPNDNSPAAPVAEKLEK